MMLICWSASPSVSASGRASSGSLGPVDGRARDTDGAGDAAAVLAQLVPARVAGLLGVHEAAADEVERALRAGCA